MMVLKVIFICLTIIGSTVAIPNKFTCTYLQECLELLGPKSVCTEHNHCQCVPNFHINNDGQCIRDKGLKEICDSSDECYWGPEMVERLECSLGVCSCVSGYIADKGRICVKLFSSASSIETTSLILAATGFLLSQANLILTMK